MASAPEPNESETPPRRPPRFFSPGFVVVALAVVLLLSLLMRGDGSYQKIPLGVFETAALEDNVEQVTIQGDWALGEFKNPPPNREADAKEDAVYAKRFRTHLLGSKDGKLRPEVEAALKQNIPYSFQVEEAYDNRENLLLFITLAAPIILLLIIWSMFRRARDQIVGGSGILNSFSRSPAQRYDTKREPITFDDVAGLQQVKADLEEVVEFLKDPKKFSRLGGRVPKGVLLMGLPGTGKTLLARAVAGEAGVPFFSINGSEFIQMFVGVGASRVRDMFRTAKENAPSILFVDEIDAVGRMRGAGLGGGHDEREQTLNQILSEMDGFSPNESTIVIAATNRPDVLDPALLRPGRFDRHITVDRPTLDGRLQILKVHIRDVPIAEDVDLQRVARSTVGMTGADLRNLVNEAALWATRNDKEAVGSEDFEYARDKVLMGATREEVLSDEEKRMTAVHEAGHALLAWLLPGHDRLHKVTIIPRGRALGVTQVLPEEDRYNISENDLHNRLAFAMGGRAAEKLVYDEYTAGAQNDLEQATRIARRMVTLWGMSERLGPVNYRSSEEHPFLGKELHEHRDFSDRTALMIDEEVSRILHDAQDRATQILADNRDKLDRLTEALLEKEVLEDHEITDLIGPSVSDSARNGKLVDHALPEPQANTETPTAGDEDSTHE